VLLRQLQYHCWCCFDKRLAAADASLLATVSHLAMSLQKLVLLWYYPSTIYAAVAMAGLQQVLLWKCPGSSRCCCGTNLQQLMLLWHWQGCSRCCCGNVLAAAGAVFNI
jgi:hypothetical protein